MGSRNSMLSQLDENKTWDILIIGGGATGLGAAVDAASRGFSTILIEADDFAKGTSSRSTKLVHGGVRYLEQGNLKTCSRSIKRKRLAFSKCTFCYKKTWLYNSCIFFHAKNVLRNGFNVV